MFGNCLERGETQKPVARRLGKAWERRGRPRSIGPAGERGIGVGPSSHIFFPFPFTKMEKEVSDFIQDSGQIKKKFQPMNKIERSIL